MTEEGEKGLRTVGNPPKHADERPTNQPGPADGMSEEETGLGPRGEAPQHTEDFSQIQGSRRGGGAASSAVRADDNPQPADE
ncbi:MAG TPA: hypothetical protein VM754_09550 [Actinomycetota bacterium]|nr:hypothetical protein [Actinomycetota bacterium]